VTVQSDDRLAAELEELAELLESDGEVQTSLRRLADLANAVVPSCDGVAITVRGRDGFETVVATAEPFAALDRGQSERGLGPLVEALRYGEPRRIDDSRREERWPAHCADAVAQGVLSSISLPMRVNRVAIAALDLYGREPNAFDGVAHDIALLLAARGGATLTHARLYHSGQRLVHQLQEALASRAVIEQAKGIVMARERCGPEEAFEILRRSSQRSHRRLREVARRLVDSVQPGDGR
jgi:GAF domain-containing protein